MERCKKLEIIIEETAVPEILKILERVGAPGYTVIPTGPGKGEHGIRGTGDVLNVLNNTLLIVVARETTATRIVQEIARILERYSGILYSSDVEVLRGERF